MRAGKQATRLAEAMRASSAGGESIQEKDFRLRYTKEFVKSVSFAVVRTCSLETIEIAHVHRVTFCAANFDVFSMHLPQLRSLNKLMRAYMIIRSSFLKSSCCTTALASSSHHLRLALVVRRCTRYVVARMIITCVCSETPTHHAFARVRYHNGSSVSPTYSSRSLNLL